jgi:circadian clock protein KaiB
MPQAPRGRNRHETTIPKFYIAGRTRPTEQAISGLKEICEKDLSSEYDEYELAVIDVLERPQLRRHEKIPATPTLVKQPPPRLRRVAGDSPTANGFSSGPIPRFGKKWGR